MGENMVPYNKHDQHNGERTRPARFKLTEEIINKRRETRQRNKTDFQKDLMQWGGDPMVKGLAKTRRQLFNMGESVKEIETILRRRFKQLAKRAH